MADAAGAPGIGRERRHKQPGRNEIGERAGIKPETQAQSAGGLYSAHLRGVDICP